MNWMWTGSGLKSVGEMVRLVDILQSPWFKKDDLKDFDVKHETTRVDGMTSSTSSVPLSPQDGWDEVSVKIRVPDGNVHDSESDAPIFEVPGLHIRSVVEVIKAVVSDAASTSFHYTPFKQFWSRPDDPSLPPERVFDEMYSSDAFLDAHAKIQSQPPEPGCTLERVVLGMMAWSDSMHLANFGDASLWPAYLSLETRASTYGQSHALQPVTTSSICLRYVSSGCYYARNCFSTVFTTPAPRFFFRLVH